MIQRSAAILLRVSTAQQARHDISIPDQRNQIMAYAKERNIRIVVEFVEAGVSARAEHRPVFQEMIEQALTKPPPFNCIIVHSMSRLFRDEMWYEWYRRKCLQNGVEFISITQDFGEGSGGDLTRRIMALTDEINSVENAKHVRRTMLENARQGYWNGSAAPLGYQTVVADVRGHKMKKKLEVEPEGAEVIRLIFRLYLVGDGASGPLGIKNIVHYLNDRGFKTPKGNRFHIAFVNKLLRDELYVGRHFYNKYDSRAKVDRPRDEWIVVPVPQIISDEDFQRVQILLTERSPKKTAPRLVNSPVLLTGVARCAGCRGLLVKETGKGGAYSYYRCSGKQREGSCPGGAPAGISAPVLDKVVLDRLLDELLTAERVQTIVAEVAQKRADGGDEAAVSLSQLQAQKGKSTKKLENLIAALAEGIVTATDTFKATLKTTEGDIERLTSMIAVQERLLNARIRAISIEEARLVASELREKLLDSPPSLKKRIVRSFVDQVLVSADEIVVTGAKSNLAEVVTGTPTGVSNPETPVPTFERAWWSRGDGRVVVT